MSLQKLSQKALLLGEHSYLDATDECYFVDVYDRSRESRTKRLILSLKQGRRDAVVELAEQFAAQLPPTWLRAYTFVPMPTSGSENGLRSMVNHFPAADIRDLVLQKVPTPPSAWGWRLAPRERQLLLSLNELAIDPPPMTAVMVDDVLATGSHFRAAKLVIRSRLTNTRVIGLFVARAVLRRRQHLA